MKKCIKRRSNPERWREVDRKMLLDSQLKNMKISRTVRVGQLKITPMTKNHQVEIMETSNAERKIATTQKMTEVKIMGEYQANITMTVII